MSGVVLDGGIKITKTKMMDLIRLFNNIEKLGTSAIFYEDCIYPVIVEEENDGTIHISSGTNDVNGVHLIENTIFREIGIDGILKSMWLYVDNSEEMGILDPIGQLKEDLKNTGIKDIRICTMEPRGIFVTITRESGTNTYQILRLVGPDINCRISTKFYNSYQDRISQLGAHTGVYQSKDSQIETILAGGVIRLHNFASKEENKTAVRISRNLFPLLGAVRQGDVSALQFDYSLIKGKNGADSILILITNYKKLHAIHIYNYIEYDSCLGKGE